MTVSDGGREELVFWPVVGQMIRKCMNVLLLLACALVLILFLVVGTFTAGKIASHLIAKVGTEASQHQTN